MPGNAAIVRRGYEAFNRGDLTKLTELVGDNVSWHTPGRSPLAGEVVGREAVLARLGRYVAETGGTFRADLKRALTDEDSRVIGIDHKSPSATASTWTSTAASSSSARTAGSSTSASTSTTFAPRTSSGRKADDFAGRCIDRAPCASERRELSTEGWAGMPAEAKVEHAPFASLKWPAGFATAALLATGLADLVAFAVDRSRYILLGRVEPGTFVSLGEANASAHRQAMMQSVQTSLYVLTAVVFIWWFRRAYRNVDALGGRGRFASGWTIGGWLVPVLALWRPKQIANDLWLTSDPDRPGERVSPAGVSPLVNWWWGLFLVSTWLAGRAAASGGRTTDDMRITTTLAIVGDALGVVAVGLAIAVVLRLTSRQRRRVERRAAMVRPAASADPDLDKSLDGGEFDLPADFACAASPTALRERRLLHYSSCKFCGRPLDLHVAARSN